MSAPGGSVATRLSDEQRLDWLQLIRSDNVGPRTFRGLINRFGGASAALRALPDLIARHAAGRQIRIADREACAREIDATQRLGARFVALGEPDYPAALRATEAAPPLLAIRGEASALRRPMVAVVGSRNASAPGLAFTDRLARGFGQADLVVVSGLARGIDQRAHRAALEAGTVAVLAGGLDRIYPREHTPLAEAICANGAVVSEMPLGWEPRGRDFPRRNRIVSGLALGTVVVEAARRSGSLITARFALEQGREVFAAPGSPLDPRAEGTNDLLRQGATMCTSPDDVVSALAPLVASGPRPQRLFETEERAVPPPERLWDETDLFGDPLIPMSDAGQEFDESPAAGSPALTVADADLHARVAELLSPAPVTIDDLVRASGAPAGEVHAVLFDLELEGRAIRAGGLVSRA